MTLKNKKSTFDYTMDNDSLVNKEGKLFLRKFLRILIIQGGRSKAETILFNLCRKLKQEHKNQSFILLFYNAIDNVKPFLEVRNVRVSGMTRQVPTIIKPGRQITLVLSWVVEAAKKRNKKASLNFTDSLFVEISDALKKRGSVKQKTEDLHKAAVLNRAFAHYRWW
jgi:small subunit ribosomal protein S7